MQKKPQNPVCVILWREAFYAFTKKFPKRLPAPQLTVGFIIDSNDKFINIAMNVSYDPKTGKLWPVDGFLIPKGAKMEFRKIGNLND